MGSVIDADLLKSSWEFQSQPHRFDEAPHFKVAAPLADLKTQVQEWVTFERTQYGNSRVQEEERRGTIFTIWFPVWDLWHYSRANFSNGQASITKAVHILFEQIDVIAENWPMRPQIILLDAIDVTFLPSWSKRETGIDDADFVREDQRYAVSLVEQWNQALDKEAGGWDKGSIHIYHANEWLVEQIRHVQLIKANVTNANRVGYHLLPWTNVHSGCLGLGNAVSEVIQDNSHTNLCTEPEAYLFW